MRKHCIREIRPPPQTSHTPHSIFRLLTDGRPARRTFPNTPAGVRALWRWVDAFRVEDARPVQVTLEATGGYEEAAASALHDAGAYVVVVNPYRVKCWVESALLRTKTDAVDAWAIAEFGRTARQLHRWMPTPPAFRALQALVRARAAVKDTQQEYRNRLQAPTCHPTVAAHYQTVLDGLAAEQRAIEAQIRALVAETPALRTAHAHLTSIPGIGHDTAVLLLGECGDCAQFTSGKQLVAFAGVSVQHADSGTSLHKKPRLSKRGAPRLRAALYFPAMTARRCLPHLRAFADRLAARGLAPKAILCAVMRKLLELVYAILRTGHPFDPHYQRPCTNPIPAPMRTPALAA